VILGIHHVGIAVDDLEAAVDRYRRVLGVEPSHRERIEDQGVEEVLFDVDGSAIQLLGALDPDTPVGRFLAKRVDGVAAALDRLRSDGVRLVDEEPRAGSRGTRIAFVHPAGMGGVLVELVQDP
jgi:methylmalonyl-CoA/ethylmalonyl-CoA epimerase